MIIIIFLLIAPFCRSSSICVSDLLTNSGWKWQWWAGGVNMTMLPRIAHRCVSLPHDDTLNCCRDTEWSVCLAYTRASGVTELMKRLDIYCNARIAAIVTYARLSDASLWNNEFDPILWRVNNTAIRLEGPKNTKRMGKKNEESLWINRMFRMRYLHVWNEQNTFILSIP